MKLSHFATIALLGMLCLTDMAFSASKLAVPTSLKPEPHQRDPYNWQARHEAVKQRNREIHPEYVMLGDSITHHWGGEPSGDTKQVAPASWQKLFASHTATNMGFGFDYADNAYFRVTDGELDGISPRVIIILLGTNNLGHRKDTPKDCAANIKALVQLVHQKCPSSKVLVLGILPRKEKNLVEPIRQTNHLLAKLHNGKTIFYADPGKSLLATDGISPRYDCLKDVVHPNAKGYEILTKEISVLLKKLDKKYRGNASETSPDPH